ncbi:MAG: Gfo/Idh/MocA family oxidoreductase [Planctomycetes bacterium]|nr:Gfo/Idh/MocA family oxidoreductase [Planctomycetota bacterium]
MTGQARIRVGVVGCGGIAASYLGAIGEVAELQLAGVVDVDAARRDAVARQTGVPPFPTLGAMLDEGGIDAALVLTPPVTHEELAVQLLRAGKHVLCEKPLTTTARAAERMLAAAATTGRTLMMGSKFRFVDDMAKARALLNEGTIGDLLLFENVFCARVDMTKRWNSRREVSGGGVLIDNGSHSVDVARYLCGPIAWVQAQFARNVQPIEVEDTCRLLLETEAGAVGAIDLSWSVHKEVPSFVRLYGAKGTIEVGWKVSRYKRDGDAEWTVFGSGYDKKAAFRNQLRNFARNIRGAEAPVITAEDAILSVRVIEAAYRSARERQWQEV